MAIDSDVDQITDHAHQLISSARVEGTPVFDRQGEKLGSVHSIMIHKTSGQVAYALLGFGGFLGLDTRVYPIPWQMLDYDPARQGYVVDVTKDALDKAPSLEVDSADRPAEVERPMYNYWNFAPYW